MEYIQEMRVWQQRNTKELGERSVGKKIQVLAVVGRFDETRHLVRRGLDLGLGAWTSDEHALSANPAV